MEPEGSLSESCDALTERVLDGQVRVLDVTERVLDGQVSEPRLSVSAHRAALSSLSWPAFFAWAFVAAIGRLRGCPP